MIAVMSYPLSNDGTVEFDLSIPANTATFALKVMTDVTIVVRNFTHISIKAWLIIRPNIHLLNAWNRITVIKCVAALQ